MPPTEQETEDGDEAERPLSWVEEDDLLSVSNRATPMTVKKISTRMNDNRVVVAENHHGRYRLKGYPDGNVILWAGGQLDSAVEVEYADE